jgi:hypothetical protein
MNGPHVARDEGALTYLTSRFDVAFNIVVN